MYRQNRVYPTKAHPPDEQTGIADAKWLFVIVGTVYLAVLVTGLMAY
jgi:hypothetical protein